MTDPLDNVRDISRIAYGFMASKVLFTALDLDLFGLLAGGAKSADRLANASASQSYLVRGAPSYFGDYYRLRGLPARGSHYRHQQGHHRREAAG